MGYKELISDLRKEAERYGMTEITMSLYQRRNEHGTVDQKG